MSLAELLDKLGENKQSSSEVYKTYKALKADEELYKAELRSKLEELGLKSAKGKDFQAMIVESPSIVVKDEHRVLTWLQERPDMEADFYIGLKVPEFKSLASSLLKETGELIDGTDVVINESLSIRKNGG